MHPRRSIATCAIADGEIAATLDDGTALACDFAILATGYRVDIAKVPYLAALAGEIGGGDGWPRPARGVNPCSLPHTVLPQLMQLAIAAPAAPAATIRRVTAPNSPRPILGAYVKSPAYTAYTLGTYVDRRRGSPLEGPGSGQTA